jgi:rRNA maturation protein Nop10
MEIVHRVGFNRSFQSAKLPELEGIELEEVGDVAVFEIEESNKMWPAVFAWISKVKASDIVTTKFTRMEIGGARWVVMRSDWLWSYPQPEKDFGYLGVTYDLRNYCDKCGAGAVQKEPFRMSGEPKWGKKDILQLNWVFGEIFVKPEVWTDVFKPNGIGFRPVVSRDGQPLKTVVQLVVDSLSELQDVGMKREKCSKCGTIKYSPEIRGFIPPLIGQPSTLMCKTTQIFGGGQRAFRRILVSQPLVRKCLESKIRGVSLIPLTTV